MIIEHKFENAGIDKSKMPLSDYLKKHGRESDGQRYVISELPSPMYKDVSVPTCLRCGSQYDQLVEVDLWISNGGNPDLSWFGCVTVATAQFLSSIGHTQSSPLNPRFRASLWRGVCFDGRYVCCDAPRSK